MKHILQELVCISHISILFILNNFEMRFLKDSIIVSLKQAVEASRWIEKLIWIFLGVVGSAYFAYLLVAQVNSWDENSILVSKQQRSINEVDFPAITFCTHGSTRYAIAERIGNALNLESKFVREKLQLMKNILIKMKIEKEVYFKKHIRFYQKECIDDYSSDFYKSQQDFERYCTVRSIQLYSLNISQIPIEVLFFAEI